MTQANDRETATITLPISELVVTYYPYMTTREMLAIFKEATGPDSDENFKYLLEHFVISIGEKTENLYELIMDMRAEDFVFLQKQLNKMFDALKKKENE
jgi:hypothetical protein